MTVRNSNISFGSFSFMLERGTEAHDKFSDKRSGLEKGISKLPKGVVNLDKRYGDDPAFRIDTMTYGRSNDELTDKFIVTSVLPGEKGAAEEQRLMELLKKQDIIQESFDYII